MSLSAFLISLAAQATIAQQAASPVRERWISEWDEGVCKLVRARGEPLAPYLMLQIVPGAEGFELWLVNPNLSIRPGLWRRGFSISFQPSGTEEAVSVRRIDFRGDRYVIVSSVTVSLETLASSTAMRLERPGARGVEILLPGLRGAVPVLRDCINDQLRRWGFDPEMYARLGRQPRSVGSMADWVSNSDYPSSALREGRIGRSVVRVRIGVDGRAHDCITVVGSGHDVLDRRTCQVSQRGRFEPALDASGRPTEALLIYSIIWSIR